MLKKLNIIVGHYGTGKTNFTLNLAFDAAKRGKKVTLVDLDIVNPYFRSSDYTAELNHKGIEIISPQMANTTLDSPALSPQIFSAFVNLKDENGIVFFDVGGDDAGATALGRFNSLINDFDSTAVYCVINKYRNLISDADDAADIISEIEASSKIKINGLINNSHLSALTTKKTILDGALYAKQVSEKTGIPIIYNAVPQSLADDLKSEIDNIYPIKIYVNLPWNERRTENG